MKKIVFLGRKGGVGKSEIAFNLFDGTPVTNIDRQNSNKHKSKGVKGSNLDDLMTSLFAENNVLMDVGASEYMPFLGSIRSLGIASEVDSWVVIVTPDEEDQKDALVTIEDLLKIGVDKRKIRVIFNKVVMDSGLIDDDQFRMDFTDVMNGLSRLGVDVNCEAYIPDTEAFKRLSSAGKPLHGVMLDDTDYLASMRSEKDVEKKAVYLQWYTLKQLCITLDTYFDRVRSHVVA